MCEVIADCRGNLNAVARHFKVSRQAISYHVRQHPKLMTTVAEEREVMLDMAELALYEKALSGHTGALIFFLRTQGRSRGYS
jgi:hypothetical protein